MCISNSQNTLFCEKVIFYGPLLKRDLVCWFSEKFRKKEIHFLSVHLRGSNLRQIELIENI